MWTILGVHGWVKTHERVSGLCEEGKMANKGDDNFVCVFCVFPKKKEFRKQTLHGTCKSFHFQHNCVHFVFLPARPGPSQTHEVLR